jgi:hypothetical protein
MMGKKRISVLSLICKPLLIALFVFGVFSLVYLRSSFLKLEYSLGDLDKKKMNCLKERKIMLAERARLLSFARLEAAHGNSESFVLPDRVMVVHADRKGRALPYTVSLEKKRLAEP